MAGNMSGPIARAAKYALLRKSLQLLQSRRHRRFVEGAKHPRVVQRALLRRIMSENADTEFGKDHRFSLVADAAVFRQATPVQSYEDLRPLIERQELTGEPCLTMEQPVYYHRTSGTVGAPKNIPVTASGLKQMKRDQQMGAYVWSRDSDILQGKGFAVSGQAVEGRMEGGTPFGSASGLLYQSQSKLVKARYVLSPEIADIEDYEARYLAMVIYGLAEPDVTGMAHGQSLNVPPAAFGGRHACRHSSEGHRDGADAGGGLVARCRETWAEGEPKPGRIPDRPP